MKKLVKDFRKFLVLIVAAYFWTAAPSGAHALVFEETFDSGTFSSVWWHSRHNPSHDFMIVEDPAGRCGKAARFEVRRTDRTDGCCSGQNPADDLYGGRIRSRLGINATEETLALVPLTALPSEKWYGFSLFIPGEGDEAWKNDLPPPKNVNITSFRSVGSIGSGNLSLNHLGNLRISLSIGDGTERVRLTDRKTGLPLEKGQWNDLVIHAKWTVEDDGFYRLWKNGHLVIDYKGPTHYKKSGNPQRFFIGPYKPGWLLKPSIVDKIILYFDEVRISDTSGDAGYNDVASRDCNGQPRAAFSGTCPPDRPNHSSGVGPGAKGTCDLRVFFDFEDGKTPGSDAWSAYKATYPATILAEPNGNHFFRLRVTSADVTRRTDKNTFIRSETNAGGSDWCTNEDNRYVTYNFSVRLPADSNMRPSATTVWQLFQYAAPGAEDSSRHGPASWIYWYEDRGFVLRNWFYDDATGTRNIEEAVIGRAGIGEWANFSYLVYWTENKAKSSIDVFLNGQHRARLAGKFPTVQSIYMNCSAAAHFGLYGLLGLAVGIMDYDNIQIKVGKGCGGFSGTTDGSCAPSGPQDGDG